jgi:hypothetical protein
MSVILRFAFVIFKISEIGRNLKLRGGMVLAGQVPAHAHVAQWPGKHPRHNRGRRHSFEKCCFINTMSLGMILSETQKCSGVLDSKCELI